MLDLPGHLPFAFPANYPEFPDSCRLGQLVFLVDILQMLVDRPNVLLEQLGDLCLRQPDRLVLKTAVDARSTILGLIEKNLAFGRKQGHRHGECPDAFLVTASRVGCHADFADGVGRISGGPLAGILQAPHGGKPVSMGKLVS